MSLIIVNVNAGGIKDKMASIFEKNDHRYLETLCKSGEIKTLTEIEIAGYIKLAMKLNKYKIQDILLKQIKSKELLRDIFTDMFRQVDPTLNFDDIDWSDKKPPKKTVNNKDLFDYSGAVSAATLSDDESPQSSPVPAAYATSPNNIDEQAEPKPDTFVDEQEFHKEFDNLALAMAKDQFDEEYDKLAIAMAKYSVPDVFDALLEEMKYLGQPEPQAQSSNAIQPTSPSSSPQSSPSSSPLSSLSPRTLTICGVKISEDDFDTYGLGLREEYLKTRSAGSADKRKSLIKRFSKKSPSSLRSKKK